MANENSNEMTIVSDPSRAVNDENQLGSESLGNVVREITTEAGELIPGDHIAVECEWSIKEKPVTTYFHHGIYISQEKGVAHFSGRTVQNAELKYDDLMDFANGWKHNTLYKIEYKENKCLPADEVVKQAIALVESQEWDKFDFTDNNCEHFASYCKTGKKSCNQSYFKCLLANGCVYLYACSVEAMGYSPCFKRETK